MQPNRLLLISERDPRLDPRVGEMIRIAAGVGAWKTLPVDIYLRGPAVWALDEFPEDLQEGNLINEYLPSIQLHGGEIFVEKSNAILKEIKKKYKVTELKKTELPKVLRKARYSITL